MKYPPLVATDSNDAAAFPMDFRRVHQEGIPHRAVHVEVVDSKGHWLVWKRADQRLEIAPAGHVDWDEAANLPESNESAAIRESSEELNCALNWNVDEAEVRRRLASRMIFVDRIINQLSSSHGNNNEWVSVFRLHWDERWGNPGEYVLSDEGNVEPRFMPIDEIAKWSVEHPMMINSALRLFLARREIMVPIIRS